jgi:hypothetical protein
MLLQGYNAVPAVKAASMAAARHNTLPLVSSAANNAAQQ